jgi:PAS domain S-box-containing protein
MSSRRKAIVPPAQKRAAGRRITIGDRDVRQVLESVQDYAIYVLDPEGRVASWNKGAERIKGYKSDEIIGQHFSIFLTPEDRAQGKSERELQIAAETGRFED